MQSNYKKAEFTLVHDLFLRNIPYRDPESACVAILMSPWFSRGWTAVELANSHFVKVVFKNSQTSDWILIDLDTILNRPLTRRHKIAVSIINGLRQQKMSSLNLLLGVLASRQTSWARDVPLISALLVGARVEPGQVQEEIHRSILGEIGWLRYGHMFHNLPTVFNGTSWCPARISDLPAASTGNTLTVKRSGDVHGSWHVAAMNAFQEKALFFGNAHPMSILNIRNALAQPEHHRFLLEPTGISPSWALIVKIPIPTTDHLFGQFIGSVSLDQSMELDSVAYPQHDVTITYSDLQFSHGPSTMETETDGKYQRVPTIRATKATIDKQRKQALDSQFAEENQQAAYHSAEGQIVSSASSLKFPLELPEIPAGTEWWRHPDSKRPPFSHNPSHIVTSDGDRSSLLHAARTGDKERVQKILRRNNNDIIRLLKCCDENGRTPVSWAAGEGHGVGQWSTLHLLLEYHSFFRLPEISGGIEDSRQQFAEICNRMDKDGRTPLAWASAEGKVATVAALLRYPEVEIELADQAGWTSLWYAANNNRLDVMVCLLDAGADQNMFIHGCSLLARVAAKGTEASLRLLLERKPDNMVQEEALQAAVSAGRMSMARALLLSQKTHFSVVQRAIENGDLPMVKMIKETATILKLDRRSDGRSAENIMIRNDDIFINAVDVAGETFENGLTSESRALLRNLASILQFALEGALAEGMSERLKANHYSWSGQYRAIQIAAIVGDVDLITLLFRAGLPELKFWTEAEGSDRSALYFAAEEGHTAAVEKLLNASDRIPRALLKAAQTRAAKCGQKEIAEAIQDYSKKQKRGLHWF